jgi:hypothetical protein
VHTPIDGGSVRAAAPVQSVPDKGATTASRRELPDRVTAGGPSARTTEGAITTAQQKILDAAAFWSAAGVEIPTAEQLAIVAGIQHGSGYWRAQIGALRTAGLLELTRLTDSGRERARPIAISSPADLQAFVFGRLSSAQRKILEVLIEVYPQALDAADLAERAGIGYGSGYWRAQLGRLRTMALVTKSGPVAALPVLFLEAA